MISLKSGNYAFLPQGNLLVQPLYLLDLGVEERKEESYSFDNLYRPDFSGFLLQYTLEGTGVFESVSADGTKNLWRLLPGSCFLCHMPENSRYYYSASYSPNPWKFFYLHFDGSCAFNFYDALTKKEGPVFSLPLESSPIRFFCSIYSHLQNGNVPGLYENSSLLYRFLCECCQEVEQPKGTQGTLAGQIRKYITTDYASIEDLASVAERFHISREHLSRIFTKATGETAVSFLQNCRVEASMNLLLNTDLTISEIAFQCGFQNANYFAKVFRKKLSKSPQDYRTKK